MENCVWRLRRGEFTGSGRQKYKNEDGGDKGMIGTSSLKWYPRLGAESEEEDKRGDAQSRGR